MGNEPSKRSQSGVSKRTSANGNAKSADKKPNAVAAGPEAKRVQINPADIKGDNSGKPKRSKKQLRMDESAHTFAPSVASSSASHYGRVSSVMITDALGDVRVNYHIDPKELGHGHYGVVRKCMHRESGEWYAIKSIRKSKVSKIEVLKREVEILKEVKHPHIIELIEVYEDERYLHLITELCTGGELFDRIIAKTQSAEGHFSEKDAAGLVRDILDAIRYCHDEKGICHRDLKPENFLFLTEAEDAPVKIIDFGLSRHDDTEMGIMQTKVGTPYYVAPEVLRREYTNSCDIWSIGVITYILLCGYPPFYGDSDTQIFDSVRVGKFDFPSPEWDEISSSAKDFVIDMLQKDPIKRPTAAVAMKHRWFKEQLGVDADAVKTGADQSARQDSLSHAGPKTGKFTKYLALQKLKKAAFGYIASNLTHAEVGALEDQFRAIDRNRDGYITLTDLEESIAQGTFNEQVRNGVKGLREQLAVGADERLNWRDFLALTMDRSIAVREDNLKIAFEHFKHTNPDYLTASDLADIFGGQGQADDIMDLLDGDGDGKISYEDFRFALMESLDETESDRNDDDGFH